MKPVCLSPLSARLAAALAAALALSVVCAPATAADAPARPAKAATASKATAAASATAVATAASAPAPVDPLETLRQRLAGRLAGVQVSEGDGPNDVRVVARSAPGPAAASPAALRAKPAGTAAHAQGPWSYQGAAGPQTWGGLKPEFGLCGNGQRQSPIDIRGGLAVELDPVKFHYQASRFGVIDNGHTVQANVAPGNAIELGGKRFELTQFHFHRPAEERIDGKAFEMSLHLVHKDPQGRLAVVTVLLDKGQPQAAVQKVWNALPLERGDENAASTPLNLAELLPTDARYYTYMGSLTTPPCTEGVQWVVMRQPVTMSPEQIELFARIYPMNARPLQQASGRRILQSQ